MRQDRVLAALLLSAVLLAPATTAVAADPPADPATIDVAVEPGPVAPGGTVEVVVRLVPQSGIKINRYPKVSLQVPAVDGVVGESAGAVGNDRSPSVEEMEAGKNYFETVDPLRVSLHVDPAARPGSHAVPAKLKFFYCVTASGFCAPKKVDVEIPLTVR